MTAREAAHAYTFHRYYLVDMRLPEVKYFATHHLQSPPGVIVYISSYSASGLQYCLCGLFAAFASSSNMFGKLKKKVSQSFERVKAKRDGQKEPVIWKSCGSFLREEPSTTPPIQIIGRGHGLQPPVGTQVPGWEYNSQPFQELQKVRREPSINFDDSVSFVPELDHRPRRVHFAEPQPTEQGPRLVRSPSCDDSPDVPSAILNTLKPSETSATQVFEPSICPQQLPMVERPSTSHQPIGLRPGFSGLGETSADSPQSQDYSMGPRGRQEFRLIKRRPVPQRISREPHLGRSLETGLPRNISFSNAEADPLNRSGPFDGKSPNKKAEEEPLVRRIENTLESNRIVYQNHDEHNYAALGTPPGEDNPASRTKYDLVGTDNSTVSLAVTRTDVASPQRSNRAVPPERDCVICFETKAFQDFPEPTITRSCDHVPQTCLGCLQTYIRVKMKETMWLAEVLSCPECPQNFQYEDIRRYADRESWDKYVFT